MNTVEICKIVKEEMPKTKNAPQLMNSLMTLLSEIGKVTIKVNELENGAGKKMVVEIKFE